MRVVETGSTNADMLALASTGNIDEGDWLVAERQNAGRGRQGRTWASPPGNLYASGLIKVRAGNPPAPTLALVAGIAVVEALGTPGLSLKWPNDVLAGRAKVAGILLERRNDAVVIGVGVNLAHHPDLPERPTTCLAAQGVTLSPETAVSALAAAFAHWLAIWRTAGLASICVAWLARAHPIGTPLVASLPDGRQMHGAFGGLDDDGALRLRLSDGSVHRIHAGDVFLV